MLALPHHSDTQMPVSSRQQTKQGTEQSVYDLVKTRKQLLLKY